ncbi:MAG: STAS domain-containing protein [Clostridia bacterium]|nr:STAS domain-containing protein [Clostridia bacterium]
MIKHNCGFEVERGEAALVLTLYGEIDHHSAVQIRTEIDTLLLEEQPRKVVLDLSHIEFMDSSGLGLIMGRYSLMQKLGGELMLRKPHERLVKIFTLAGLQRMVKIEDAEDDKKEERV